LVVDSYVAMEAAVPLSCYFAPVTAGEADVLPGLPNLLAAETVNPTPNDYRELGYRGFLRTISTSIKGNFVNYHNLDDFWLVVGRAKLPRAPEVHWIKNQLRWKPNDIVGPGHYAYRPSNGESDRVRLETFGINNDRRVEDPHEGMAYVARSRTHALGGEPSDGVPSTSTGSHVDLSSQYGFGRARPDHSGQFQRNIHFMYESDGVRFTTPLYRQLMTDLRINNQ
jgi:hypothetical protein